MSRGVKVVIYCMIFILSNQFVSAQLEGGIKIGLSNTQIANPTYSMLTLNNDGTEDYKINIDEINVGYYFGGYTRLQVWKIFLQLEGVINSSSVNYKVQDFNSGNSETLLKEQYTSLDIPLLLGLKLNWFNIQGGVIGHIPISSVSELKNIEGYNYSPESFTYSYLAGFGIDIWKLRFDFRYELSTTYFGDHIEYMGNKYQFTDLDNRIIAGVAYSF